MCAGITYQRLYLPSAPAEPIFQHVRTDKDDGLWRFYRHPGDAQELPTRPSHAILTACHQAGLFRIVNENLNLYCGMRGPVSAYKVLDMYQKYLDWKETLPPILARYSEGDQPLPHMLYLQYVRLLVCYVYSANHSQRPIPYRFSAAFQTPSPWPILL